MKKVKDKEPRYRVEYYKDKYNTLHQVIKIDLFEEKQSNGISTIYIRSKINPNLTNCYREFILNKNGEILEDTRF